MRILIKFRKSIMLVCKLFMLFAVVCAFIGCWQNYYEEAVYEYRGNYLVVFAYAVIFFLFAHLYSGFKIGTMRVHEAIYSMFLSLVMANFIMYMVLCLIARQLLPPAPMASTTVLQTVLVAGGVIASNSIYFSLYRVRHILAVFGTEMADWDIIQKMANIKERYVIDRGISISQGLEAVKAAIDKYEAVLIGDLEKSAKNEVLRYTYATRKRIYLLPSVNDIILNNCYQSHIFDTPVLVCRNGGLTTEQQIIKRAMDIVLSLLILVVTSPIMLLTAIGIKLCDGGPVFYKQNRVTQNGRIFNIYKFRSMAVDAEKDGAARAVQGDRRITKIGRILRPLRIDELPQLFNVLKGDMSLVGPRPERTENVHEYGKLCPEFNLRHRVKAGITGYAQIYGKYNTSPLDKLNMDLIYIEQYSVLLDLKLLIMTLKIPFMRESSEAFKSTESRVSQTEEEKTQ